MFELFLLPYHIQVEIISHLTWEEIAKFATTSRQAKMLARDQFVWKKMLWNNSKIINVCLETKKNLRDRRAQILVKDHLLVDMKKLYEVLHPSDVQEIECKEVERENFMSKIQPQNFPTVSATRISIQDLFSFIETFFHRPPPVFYDPFQKGQNAPSFMLFGPPETKSARKFALSFIASKNNIFETVGLVKGRPGGVGGGVTVAYGSQLINFLPVRRARPRLIINDPLYGIKFHPDVARVVKQVDGLIYYLDARCKCDKNTQQPNQKIQNRKECFESPRLRFSSPWQSEQEMEAQENNHPLCNEFYELEAMIKATPDVFPPILIILVSDDDSKNNIPEKENLEFPDNNFVKDDHSPFHILHRISSFQNPWMISKIDVESLKGVHQSINWLIGRTNILKGIV